MEEFSRVPVLLLSLAVLANASTPEERRSKYPQLYELVVRAQSTPPEFAASTLLRVLGSDQIADREWKLEIAEQAFHLAGMAQVPIRRRLLNPEQVLAAGFGMDQDRLTLQTAVIRQMIALKPERAKELFQQVRLPEPDRNGCQSGTLGDPADYYATLASINSRTPATPDERLALTLNVISAVQSPMELPPLLDAIQASALSPNQVTAVSTVIPSILDRLSGDGPAFTYSLKALDAKMRAMHPSDQLLQSYRSYLVRHFTAERCSTPAVPNDARTISESFNATYVNADHPSLTKLTEPEWQPSKLVPSTPPEAIYSRPSSAEAKAQFMRLMFGNSSRAISDEEKSKEPWREAFQDYLRFILDLKPETGESARSFFVRKSNLMGGAIAAVPGGPDREKTIGDYLAFLANEDMQRENFPVWLNELDQLASVTRVIRPQDYRRLLKGMESAGNPVITLYALRERLLPALVQ